MKASKKVRNVTTRVASTYFWDLPAFKKNCNITLPISIEIISWNKNKHDKVMIWSWSCPSSLFLSMTFKYNIYQLLNEAE